MASDLNQEFFNWLIKQPNIGEPSAKSYSSPYFNRACRIWDESMTQLTPLKDSLNQMIGNADYHGAIEQVLLTLEDIILRKVRIGEMKKTSGDNVRTSLHRFQEFIDSTHNNAQVKNSISSTQNLPAPSEIVEEIKEDDYDIEILRKKFQARIASVMSQ